MQSDDPDRVMPDYDIDGSYSYTGPGGHTYHYDSNGNHVATTGGRHCGNAFGTMANYNKSPDVKVELLEMAMMLEKSV